MVLPNKKERDSKISLLYKKYEKYGNKLI